MAEAAQKTQYYNVV